MGEPVRTIHDLDTKILQHIFSYLSLVDKLKLALIHHNATDLIKDALRNETFDAFDIQITFSAVEAECILACYGDFIRKYRHVSTCEDENSIGFLSLIPEYCQNLEEIVLSGRELKPNDFYSRLLSVSKHVKALTLRKCILGNASCSLLSGLSKLEVLNLEDSKLTGKDLNKLRNLIDLNLKNCRNFKARNFIEICKSNKLKKLNIVGLKQLTHACIQTLLDTQADIQILIVGNKYWFKDPSRIFQLKNLLEVSMISCYEPIAATYLKTLADEQKESLECLEVNFGNSYPENDGDFLETNIVGRICEFDNLKVLSLRNSALLEDQHLVRIAKMCKHLEMLDIHGTGFRDIGIISSVEHLERLRYLDISYCTVKRTLYSRLLATRQEQGSSQQLVVYIKPKMELESLLISDEYKSYQRFVKLVVDPMRLNNEISILERLQQLNTTHPQKHQYRELRRRRLNNRFETLHQKVSLLSLDENSLHHIIQYLDLSEKLTLILINEHFCSVVKHFLHKDFVVFVEIISNFTVNEARKILSRCGSMMKRLYIQNPVYHLDTEYYDLIAEFCVNLEELLCEDLIGVSSLASIIRASSGTLEILGLYRCEADESVEMEIARASNLKKLSLIGNDYVGSHISQLRKLVDLDLAWCEKFRPEHFITICRNNRLEKLAIRGCTALNNEAFSVLSETQHHLQKLKLGGIYVASNIFTIANLPNIIDIRVTDIAAQEIIECLNALINHRAADVQCLGIQCLDEPKITMLPTLRNSILEFRNLKFLWLSCSTFVNDAYLRQIVKSCPLLEALDLSFIYDLTNDGILYPIKHLKHLQHLNVKECRQLDDILTLYQEVLKIKVQQVDAQSLVLYLDLPCDGLKETKEYAVMKKYVTILKDRFSDSEKEQYFKTKRAKYKTAKKPPIFNTAADNNQIQNIDMIFHVNILDLPASCLLKVASYLGTIDKLNFVSAHSCFLDSTRSLIESMVFNVNEISQSFTLREARDLFKRCGRSIKRIEFSSLYSNYLEYLKLIQPYREHFTEIHLSNILAEANVEEHKKLFDSPLQRLQKIVFKNVAKLDPFLTIIENKDELKILNASCYDGNGILFNQFGNLTELSLAHCGSWEPSTRDFIEICRKCKLKVLDIHACDCLTLEAFNVLIETQNECLERLSMWCDYEDDICSDVAKLSNLRYIVIEFQTNISLLEKVLDKLVKYHRNDLISLEVKNITYYLPDFVVSLNETVHERIKKFNNLQKFAINVSPAHSKSYR